MLDSIAKALAPIWFEKRQRARQRLAEMATADSQPRHYEQPRERVYVSPARQAMPGFYEMTDEMRAHRRSTRAADNLARRW